MHFSSNCYGTGSEVNMVVTSACCILRLITAVLLIVWVKYGWQCVGLYSSFCGISLVHIRQYYHKIKPLSFSDSERTTDAVTDRVPVV